MSDGAQLLVSLIRDALTGQPVKLGLLETPKLLAAIKSLKDDPQGRRVVFVNAVSACIAADPAYADLVRTMIAAYDAEV